jgi:hypothetical protein
VRSPSENAQWLKNAFAWMKVYGMPAALTDSWTDFFASKSAHEPGPAAAGSRPKSDGDEPLHLRVLDRLDECGLIRDLHPAHGGDHDIHGAAGAPEAASSARSPSWIVADASWSGFIRAASRRVAGRTSAWTSAFCCRQAFTSSRPR